MLMVLEFYREAGVSQIGRRANIPVDRVRKMLDFLIKRGLVAQIESDDKRIDSAYIATRRGGRFLEAYKRMIKYVTEITMEEKEMWNLE